jgi:cytochrome c oxidase subunit 3
MATDTLLHESLETDDKSSWSGGRQPFKASYGKLMMWYFLLSDSFTFAGFLIAYGALRFSSPSWPVPDFVFSSFPGGFHGWPLIFVTVMTFVLLFSSFTMVRAVQEGHRENRKGVVFWMILTIIGGAAFLGCQAWEWNTLLGSEHMTITKNPFGTHTEGGVYLTPDGKAEGETFEAGATYLLHKAGDHAAHDDHAEESNAEGNNAIAPVYEGPGEYADAVVDKDGFILKKYKVLDGENAGKIKTESLGPKAFGAIFFFVTGFHGFHVLSGVIFLIIIMVNSFTGLYAKRKNGYEMVEKIGLYWHFVDLVWVFVFLVFYLL